VEQKIIFDATGPGLWMWRPYALHGRENLIRQAFGGNVSVATLGFEREPNNISKTYFFHFKAEK
jgi:hypothetical protein